MSKTPEFLMWGFIGSILAMGVLGRWESATRHAPVRTPTNVHCTITPDWIAHCDLSDCRGKDYLTPEGFERLKKCARDLSLDEKEPPK